MTNDTLFTSRCDTAGGAGGGGLGSNLGFGKMASGSLDNLKPVSLPQVMEVHEPCFADADRDDVDAIYRNFQILEENI